MEWTIFQILSQNKVIGALLNKNTKKRIKPKHQNNARVREPGIRAVGDKCNRSASPHALTISNTGIKRGRNQNVKPNYKDRLNYQTENNVLNSNMLAKNPTVDYLQSKHLKKAGINQAQMKSEFDKKKYSEPQIISKNNIGAISNLGSYKNKTFYTVNQPKRAGTTLTNYQGEMKKKTAIKKLIRNINFSNNSNESINEVTAMRGEDSLLQHLNQYKSSVKGNEKIFLPIYEVLNQARIDQNSTKNIGLNEILKKSNPIRKAKTNILQTINHSIDQDIEGLNKSNELKIDKNSLTYDNIQNIEKIKQRESLPANHKRKKAYKFNMVKKSSSS